MSKVTVIIPTYNRADKLNYSVKSVLDQTLSDFSLIIIDDCSHDNTEEVVRNIGDKRIIYYRLDSNKGAGGARNEGVRIATTEYIAFQDSDDVWLPDKLERQLRYMEGNPNVGMVYGKIHIISQDKDYIFPNEAVKGRLEGDIFSDLLMRNTIDTPTMFIRKSDFEEVGGFDTTLRSLEDWEFAIRFSKRYKIGFIDDVLIDSFITEGSVSSNIAHYFESRCKMISMHREDLIKMGLFDSIVMDVFRRAEASGILPLVQKMLLASLSM